MCGIILSRPNMTREPRTIPITDISGEEMARLSGMSSRKEMASMTPAAKQSILQIYPKEGIFIMPIAEPITGPKTAIITIQNKGSIMNTHLMVFLCRLPPVRWYGGVNEPMAFIKKGKWGYKETQNMYNTLFQPGK
jgi:hypothetical protein